MSGDDPRHGTYAGAAAHWGAGQRPCGDCARAEWRYRKSRKLRLLRGEVVTVPAVGIVRRVQALHALGWTGPQIARECGLPIQTLRSIDYHGSKAVRAATAARVCDTFERLCMTRPEGRYANRARGIAARRGWAPPLAWNEIDDPDERPTGIGYDGVGRRAAEIADLLDRGVGIHEVCRVLRVTRDGLEKWCERHGHSALFSRLIERDQTRYWRNGGASGGAA